MPKHHHISLSRGDLDLTYEADEFELDELLDFAERINPKRAFLFVSKVLGRHIPVAPSTMRQAFATLANKIPNDLPTPLVVIGMAETAVGLSAGVHECLKARYPSAYLLNSTRHTQNAPLFATFSEEHSHASTHLIYLSDDESVNHAVRCAKTIIMVDDEASTGKTCQNVMGALIASGMTQLEQVHLATLVDWSLGKMVDGTFVMPDRTVGFYRHHLLSGSWRWTPTHDKAVNMPDVATTKAGNCPIFPLPSWGRTPTQNSMDGLPNLYGALPDDIGDYVGKSVLVLGVNEFVWLPFLLAERLENQGIIVKFSAITRSPIAQGGAIAHVHHFADSYGLGMTNFVYNVDFDAWDLVIVCAETPPDSMDKLFDRPNIAIVSPFNHKDNS
ncbi:MAG: phosphoribosyltransferase domain-containing protein [Moraxella sp.]|nr:phosphoribosyltransferase domain-containing protein [Moraxella sp.]